MGRRLVSVSVGTQCFGKVLTTPPKFFVSIGWKEVHYCGIGSGKRKRNSRIEEFSRGFQCRGDIDENEILTV